MRKPLSRFLIYSILSAIVIGLIALMLRPSPLAVDAARVASGPLRVVIEEDGEARAHDRYVIAAPVAGRLERIELHDGEPVARNQVVTRIDPPPLDPRQRQEATARVDAAEARHRQAMEEVERARAHHQLALRELDRAERLAQDGTISAQLADQRRSAAAEAGRELSAAQFQAQASAEDVKVAQAALLAVNGSADAGGAPVSVRSPVAGKVLRIIEKSERVVSQGTPLLSIGDPSRLEVVIDILSSDAVKVTPGTTVLLTGWGGPQPLRAAVRTVEPYAFTKTSALGVEEQRVNIVADFVDPPGPLGDGYRVEAQIVLWERAGVLKVPVGALFRQGDRWAVFQIGGDRAHLRQIEVGQIGSEEAEVLGGLAESDEVISHPPNELKHGDRITRR